MYHEISRGRASAGRHPQPPCAKQGLVAKVRGGRGGDRTGAWRRRGSGGGTCAGERGGAGSPSLASPGSSGAGGGAAKTGKDHADPPFPEPRYKFPQPFHSSKCRSCLFCPKCIFEVPEVECTACCCCWSTLPRDVLVNQGGVAVLGAHTDQGCVLCLTPKAHVCQPLGAP